MPGSIVDSLKVPAAIVAGLAATAFIGIKMQKARKLAAFRAELAALDQSIVHIFAFPRMSAAPNIAPAAIKLEAFCRIHKIAYEIHFTLDGPQLSPTETAPFIYHAGKLVGESQFCIDYIRSVFNIPTNDELTPIGEAIATLVRRTCELSLLPHNSRTTIVDNADTFLPGMVSKWADITGYPPFVVQQFVKGMRKTYISRLNASGLGWLSDEQYQIEYLRDVRALSAVVQESQDAGRKHLFGDVATTADCVLYSVIASINTAPKLDNNTAGFDEIRGDPVLQSFAKHFEETVFPDLASITPSGLTTQKFPPATPA